MASIASLRETLRPQIGDVARLVKDRRFQNENLEQALFDALQQHNRTFRWQTLPQEEEQLVLLLAKSRLAKDMSLTYALDPKMTAGPNLSRDKTQAAGLLLELSSSYRDEYLAAKALLFAPPDSDVTMGTLVRRSRTTGTHVPAQSTTPPNKPFVSEARYEYNSRPRSVFTPSGPAGFIHFKWRRPTDGDLSFVRVYVSHTPHVGFDSLRVRTIYDLYSDPIRYAQPPAPQPQPSVPQLNQVDFSVEKTLLPTGEWYIALVSFTWNMLFAWSEPISFEVANSIGFSADMYGYDDMTALTSTTTTTSTSTTTSTTTVRQGDAWDVTFSATPVFDFSKGGTQVITLGGNVTSSEAINFLPGETVTFSINNPSGDTFVWPSNVFGGMEIGTGVNTQQFNSPDGVNLYATTFGVTS